MIQYPTVCVETTHSGTGIATLELLTRLVRWAIAVGDALRTTCLIGIAMILGQTLTGAGVAFLPANGIGTTGIRVAGLCRLLLLHQLATTEGISRVTRCTVAHRSMAEHMADGIGATDSGAGIRTLLPDAGLVEGTFRVGYTFRSTAGRSSNVVRQACALRLISVRSTLRIRSTRRGLTGIRFLLHSNIALRLLWFHVAANEGIASVSRWARADGRMIHHLAEGIEATAARAGIDAVLLLASQTWQAVRVACAFRTTLRRCAHIILQAGADRVVVQHAATTVGSTRRRSTRIGSRRSLHSRCFTLYEGVPDHSLGAVTVGNVIDHITDGIWSTGAGTGIDALIPHTCAILGAIRVEHTLGSATHIGIALILGQASALTRLADGIGATG